MCCNCRVHSLSQNLVLVLMTDPVVTFNAIIVALTFAHAADVNDQATLSITQPRAPKLADSFEACT